MNLIITISSILVILTKLADVISTLRFLKTGNIGLERNKIARKIMFLIGSKRAIWGVFAFTIILVISIQFAIMRIDIYWYQWAYVVTALIVSIFQASVAFYNITGRSNVFVRLISRLSLYR